MFHVKLDIFIHRNTTESNTAMSKNTGNISVNIPELMRPTLMHYELCFLHMAHTCPDDRQSSCSSFTATATLYIWVTKIQTYMWKQHPLTRTYQSPFLFATPSLYFQVTLSYIWVAQNTTLATSNPSNNVSFMGSTIRTT